MNKTTTALGISAFFLLTSSFTYAGSATWDTSPTSGDWNTAANWTPATVPNGPADTASFGVSNTTTVAVSANAEVAAVVFDAGASPFIISTTRGLILTISGAGVSNNSGHTQNFDCAADAGGLTGEISFLNSTSAGSNNVFTNEASKKDAYLGAKTTFHGKATADHATFINNTGNAYGTFGGTTQFLDTSTAGHALITNNGMNLAGIAGAATIFTDRANADHSTIICNPGGPSARGAVAFSAQSTAGDSTLIANGGGGGGETGGMIFFLDDSRGGKARIQLFGNGTLYLAQHNSDMKVGSLEGDGIILLGGLQTCAIGANSKSTTFAGVIKDGDIFGAAGAIAKVGAGSLTLTGANTYTGGTTVILGTLVVSNTTSSATGSGAVQANAGTLGGNGIIAGAVTIGTGSGPGAFLAPSITLFKASKLAIQDSLTFKADSTYVWGVHPERITADQVNARGVTIGRWSVIFSVGGGNADDCTWYYLHFTENNSAQPIIGTFSNLADGSTITVGNNTFQANYEGGDGNDLTLTVL